jgi:hypothetical protein
MLDNPVDRILGRRAGGGCTEATQARKALARGVISRQRLTERTNQSSAYDYSVKKLPYHGRRVRMIKVDLRPCLGEMAAALSEICALRRI